MRKELAWIKKNQSGTQSKEESGRKRLAEKHGEIEWLKKMPVETQAELDRSGNEPERLRVFPRLVLLGHHLTLRAG